MAEAAEPEAQAAGTPAAAPASPPTVVVAVLTYLRPDDLLAAVDALLRQVDRVPARASVLVVDNDPDGGAMALADRWAGRPVRFVHEPEPGIAAARNRALDEAGDADLLVFIDDDERPREGWLAALVGTWRETGAAAVVGPVESTFHAEPDPWIAEGGFFRRRRLGTGTEVDVAATNNLLLDLGAVRRRELRFDPAFGASGGSDTLFTRQLHRRGGTMVWCAEATVLDVVPPERLTRSWVLRRGLRLGNSWSRVALALEDGPIRRARVRVALTVAGVARLVAGGARIVLGVATRSVHHRARGAKTLVRGAGMAAGAWGYTYHEYRRPRSGA